MVQKVRDEVNDLRKKPRGSSTVPQAASQPYYQHYSPSNSSEPYSYSHTATSTAGYSQTNTYPRLTEYREERVRKTLLEKTEALTSNILENMLGQDNAVSATNMINNVITQRHNARELLRNGATLHLISKSSGRLLQIVMSSNGALIFDGNGTTQSFNTYFTVETSEHGRIRLHNNHNYLAFESKQPCVISFPPGVKNNVNVDFRIHDILGSSELIALESCAHKNHFISVAMDGHLKTTNIKDKSIDAQFSVIPVVPNQQSMFPNPNQPYQQFNMNPYSGFPSNSANGYASASPPTYYEQPTAPPPPYSEVDPHNQSSTSSSLYPKFN